MSSLFCALIIFYGILAKSRQNIGKHNLVLFASNYGFFTDSDGRVQSRRFVCRMKCAFSCSSRFYTAFQVGNALLLMALIHHFRSVLGALGNHPTFLAAHRFEDYRSPEGVYEIVENNEFL